MKKRTRTRRLRLGLRARPEKGGPVPPTTQKDNVNTVRANPSGCWPSTATKTNNPQLIQGRPTGGLGTRPGERGPSSPAVPLSPNTPGRSTCTMITPGRSTRTMDRRGSPRRRSTPPYPHSRARAREARPKERDVRRPNAGHHSRPGEGPACRPGPSHQVDLRPAARGHARSRPCSRPCRASTCPVPVRRQRE